MSRFTEGDRARTYLAVYCLAILASAVVTACLLLVPHKAELSAGPIFLLPVALASWYAGRGPGLVALAAGVLGETYVYLFTSPPTSATLFGLQVGVYVAAGCVIVWLTGGLHRSRNALQAIVHSSPLPLFAVDLRGNVTHWTPAAERVLGWTEREVVGKPVPMVPMNEAEEYNRLLTRSLQGDMLPGVDVKRQTKDGSILDLSVSTAPLPDAWGRIAGSVAVYADIRERKRAEEELQKTSQFNRAVIDHADEAIAVYDRELRYVLWNQRMELLTGMKAEEVIGQHALELFPHLREQGVDRILEQALAGETVRSADVLYRIPRTQKSGWVTGSYTPQWDAHGNVVGVIAVLLDVTARKQTEEELRASEERYRLTFDHAAVGIAHVDPGGRFLRVNEGLCAMLGYSQKELLTSRFQELTHPDDLMRNLEQFEQLLSGQIDFYAIDKRFLHKDGSEIWAVVRTALVRDASNEPEYTISVIEDMSDRVHAEEALRHQALHDALTGLPNRTLLRKRLDEEIVVAQRSHSTFALLLLDLDRFKEINDTFGHHVGDDLLLQVARRLCDILRAADTVARLGGDEFAILLPGTDAAGGNAAARKILRVLEQPFMYQGHRLEFGASIGVAVYPEHGDESPTLLRHADVAMYVAKRQNSRAALYLPSEDIHTPNRLALMTALHAAVRSRHLDFHYQPQVNLRSNQVERVEVLARWVHPEHGLVPPSQFIPLAEQTGLIKPLTLAALNAALPQCLLWHQSGMAIRVAINLSASSLQDSRLPAIIRRLLTRHGVPPECLEVEITEGAVMIEPERALRVLSRLHTMGVKIALDDFGTGYSSLGYLKRLPVDVIKIDRSFVGDMATNGDDATIVRATTNLAHDLGLEVVAEGVENIETWNLLREIGCDLVQGYYISRPLSREEFTWWLKDHADAHAPLTEPGNAARLHLLKRQTS